MLKNKLITLSFVALFALSARVAFASVLSIQQLPGYINTNNFRLSCTSNGGTYQFEVSKNGGAFSTFGPSIDTGSSQCVVQVDSSIVNEQAVYTFRIGDKTTSTTYDSSGPNPVSGYYKERISDGEYKLHWRNPDNTDFDKVIIYRGETSDFSADGSHEIARVSGSPNSEMSYEDHFAPDAGKNYYYAIRAIDRASNSSSLEGDSGTTTTATVTGSVTGASSTNGKVTVLPSENGSILGTEATPESTQEAISESELNTNPGLLKWMLTHKKASLGVALALGAIAYFLYSKSKKK